jgi:hypothetical protein
VIIFAAEKQIQETKMKTLLIVMVLGVFVAGTAFGQMGGGMGGGPGSGSSGRSHMGGGMGYGTAGAGGMASGMMGSTISHGYLETLAPIDSPDGAWGAVEDFLAPLNSGLQISEIWEYGTAFKVALSDANGAKAFDLIVDKFTGLVSPEMGFSMMMNASYGRSLYRTGSFGRNVSVTPQQAIDKVQEFVTENALGYTLAAPERYPGYYKFHTTTPTGPGMDIMVSGYNGRLWMNTLLGMPIRKISP